ncbi:Cellulose synthase-like protein G3 [Dichanthelium oligosanthes]|uniref:Cellulose synthase-like protein G3 n=1 Tax=Dichanthelium oligosanthes TaxID=888268 RepID=A0A1E5UL30_9POAL|nr:Cellulose synthase-like protein G3 [Dichanthelium oligosanthes]
MATPANSQAPFSAVHVSRPLVIANRVMAAVHAALVAAVIAHRALRLLSAASAAMALADLTLLFLWVLSQSGLWRPVSRAAFPERLLASPRRSSLPGVDVLVVTADPDKEPALVVMNTVVSAMALDYPGGRLSVYLSDDAGSPLTLLATRKAYAFARAWVPFCRKHSVQCPWPDRYFAGDNVHDDRRGEAAAAEERRRIKEMYETFKGDIEEASRKQQRSWTEEERRDHDAHVEIIAAGDHEQQQRGEEEDNDEEATMPLLVYVSREKRRASPHHFKAGALNVLLRVSSLMSNAAYALVLDCDMSCNSRASALEAMCIHLDHRSPPAPENLAFVQFPQMFHNLSSNDIYTNDLRYIFKARTLQSIDRACH